MIQRLTMMVVAVGLAITCNYGQSRDAGRGQRTSEKSVRAGVNQVFTTNSLKLDSLPVFAAESITPPRGAGYVLPDGTVQIVGWDEMRGIVESLNSLFVKAHPGFKFKYIPGNTMAPQHSLIFDETAFAPIGMEFSTNLGSAYGALVHGEPFGIRIAHGSLNPTAKLSPLAIIAHKTNPLENLSFGQVTHIFTVGGRGPDIVNCSQAGVKSDLGSREIHSYGLPESDHYPSEDIGFGCQARDSRLLAETRAAAHSLHNALSVRRHAVDAPRRAFTGSRGCHQCGRQRSVWNRFDRVVAHR